MGKGMVDLILVHGGFGRIIDGGPWWIKDLMLEITKFAMVKNN